MQLEVGFSTNLKSFRAVLDANPNAALRFILPDGSTVPPSFHVTEVGRVRKDFIDCGGTVRSTERCVLQLWMGDDDAHRLQAAKLSRIITLAEPLLGTADLAVEVEYDLGVITQLPIATTSVSPDAITFRLGSKHTACLAPDRCGERTTADAKCCVQSGKSCC